MTTVAEAQNSQSSLNASLIAGINTISANQTVTFIQYQREVLPIDGYVFWINTGQTFAAQGSVHVATTLEQREDETIGIARIIFTSEQAVQDFNAVAPGTIYIGTIGENRFAFSNQANFYQQSGLYHYRGEAIYPAMETQIIDNPAVLNTLVATQIISNSLPLWLTLSTASVFGLTNPTFPIYPSFLVPQDASPPYATIHIGESDTEAIQSAPWFDFEYSHWQLAKDRVRITMYGLSNAQALDFQDFIFQYSLNTDNMGVMNTPIMRDEKRTQRELGIIAQKKSFSIDISYYQSRLQTLSRQFILHVVTKYLPQAL